jgi:hypothetical protein
MSAITTAQTALTRTFWRTGLLLKRNSPHILVGAGILGIVATTIMASKATLKLEETIREPKLKIEEIKRRKENYEDQEYAKRLTIEYIKAGKGFLYLYGPAISLGTLSIASILSGHNIMQKRNVALGAAFNMLTTAFQGYRARGEEEVGSDREKMFYLGLREEEITTESYDAEGKKVKTKKKIKVKNDGLSPSIYARFFDQFSPHYKKNATMNLYFLRSQQQYANDILKDRGHLFLNEVYDWLGIPRTTEGQLVGWVYNNKANPDEVIGDPYVDFGIYSVDNPGAADFVNGYERAILLDFNVAGVVHDLI